MNKSIFVILLVLLHLPNKSQSQSHYDVGDALYVVALAGSNLRNAPDKSSQVIAKLDNGEAVKIKKVTSKQDSIEFNGFWVEVETISSAKTGYLFDVFLSRYKVVEDLNSAKGIKELDDLGKFASVLSEYTTKAFSPASCEVEYTNGIDGEPHHAMTITPLDNGAKYIEHSYWESSEVELELSNARNSEVYYMIKNILKLMPLDSKHYTKNEWLLMHPKNTNWKCEVMTENGCLIDVRYKGNNTVSLYFKYACC